MLNLFRRRVTPQEMYNYNIEIKRSIVPNDKLKKGAERQWKRIFDSDYQTKEMIKRLNEVVPPKP